METPRNKVDRGVFLRLYAEGLRGEQLSRALGVTPRTVLRMELELGVRPPHVRNSLTDEQKARAKLLREEGMPVTWIAEDIGCDPSTVTKQLEQRPDHVAEWKVVWQEIRRSEELRDWHDLFYPKKDRRVA